MTLDDHLNGPVLVIGASGIDLIGRPSHDLKMGASNPGYIRYSYGGVARNVAENLARLGVETILISAVGEDERGEILLDELRKAQVNVDYVLIEPGHRTGSYLGLVGTDGNLVAGIDDMEVMSAITPRYLQKIRRVFNEASVLFVDANLSERCLASIFKHAARTDLPVAADPTSMGLANKLESYLNQIWLIAPNEAEAEMICPHSVPHADVEVALSAARHLVSHGVEIAIITMAEFGVAYATTEASGHIPAVRTNILDPTGAGDALTAAVIYALLNGIPLDEAVRLGVAAATLTLRTRGTVVPDLSLEMLYDGLR